MIGFSTWRPIDALGEAPQAPGVFQVKIEGPLIDYPRGKSAMVYYGAGPDLRAALVAMVPSLTHFGTLAWRILATADYQAQLERHLRRFRDQFDAAPAGN